MQELVRKLIAPRRLSTGRTRGVVAIVSNYYYYCLTLGAGRTRGAVAMVMQ